MHFERIADKKRIRFITSEICKYVPAGSQVLDIGCGNGIISKAVALEGYKVTAIDVSNKTIEAARAANPHPDIEYKMISADDLMTEPLKYGAIICSEVLEHLREPTTLLDIIYKSLKADGILLVTVPNGYGPRELFVTRPVQYLQQKNNFLSRTLTFIKNVFGYRGITVQSSADDLTHIQFFSVKQLRELAARSGFSIDTIRKTNFVEQVFPVSLFTRKILWLQNLDCKLADLLPLTFTSGFMSVWKKS